MVLRLTVADSAGISLLDEKKRTVRLAGGSRAACFLTSAAARPETSALAALFWDRDEPVLFLHPERHFTYLEPISPPLEEVLLIPFHVDNRPVGTIWAVIHTPDRKFQSEDRRLLQNLSAFASQAFKVLASTGTLDPLLVGKSLIQNSGPGRKHDR